MATLNQLVFNVRNSPDKGKAERAKNYSDRQIAFWINSTRAFLISKDVEKNKTFPVALEQDLGCWPLTTVDQADCPGGFEWGDDVKKASFPPILELYDNAGLAFFGYIDKRTRITVPSSNYGILDDFQRFKNKKDIIAYQIGPGDIYIKGQGAAKLCTVNIRGVFKDPTLVTWYDEKGVKYCYDDGKTEYPITGDLERALYQIIFEDYVLKFAGAPDMGKNNEKSKQLV